MGTDVFFPDRGVTDVQRQAIRDACRPCPVQAECLAEAMSDPLTLGYWADTSTRERMKLRKKMRYHQLPETGSDA